MTWLPWAALAAALAITAEALFRRGVAYGDALWLFIPIAIGINYAIYRLVVGGPSLLVAIAGFNLMTVSARIGVSQFVLHEPVARGNLVAAGALFAGVIVGSLWR